MNEIIERITKILKYKKITQKKLAEETGIKESTISEWKKGSIPKSDAIIKIAKYLNITTDYILLGKEKEYISEMEKLYNRASSEDKKVIDLILSKYENVETSSNTKTG